MPKISGISDQYQFYFFSNELSGGQREPVHVHIRKDNNQAKCWIDGSIAYNKGFKLKELQHIQRLVASNKSRIEEVWNEHFGEQ
jgi:hypothetical protein